MTNKTFTIVNSQFIKLTSVDQSINFKKQQIRLEIFVFDRKVTKHILLCCNLIDPNQVDPTIIQFPTDGENFFIVASSLDHRVNLDKLQITGL